MMKVLGLLFLQIIELNCVDREQTLLLKKGPLQEKWCSLVKDHGNMIHRNESPYRSRSDKSILIDIPKCLVSKSSEVFLVDRRWGRGV